MNNTATNSQEFEAIRAGDKKVFDTFFLRHYPMLCGYAYQFVGEADGEEIIQDIMVWLWENRENIVIESSLINYLFRAVRNKCINHINKNKIREQVHNTIAKSQHVIDDPDFYIVEELTQKIKEALDRLPPTYREAFTLNRIEGKTYKEIADLLHVSSKTIDYRIQQALKDLRIQLKDYLPLLLPLLAFMNEM
ncbi:RNA polymerase sigma-70 factor [Parabacteroides sp. OttesenSCG-928-K15]|nr:RNA polymerase sigma-70 factor [Parabacteroides sp. OttesenSCG-928-K15]